MSTAREDRRGQRDGVGTLVDEARILERKISDNKISCDDGYAFQ
jgi:hypothetical protein